MLGRANLYTFDPDGNKFRRKHAVDDPGCTGCGTGEWRCWSKQGKCCAECWHPPEIPIHETPRHALSHHNTDEVDDGREEARREAARRWERLTPEEVYLLQLQDGTATRLPERFQIIAGELVRWQRKGYDLVPGSQCMVERGGGLSPVECVDVYGHEIKHAETMTYHEIAEHTGMSWRKVKRDILEARRKLKEGGRP